MVVSRKRHGACAALVWSDTAGRYHCGLMLSAGAGQADLASVPWWQRPVRALALLWVRRVISAGSGCDASLEVKARPSEGDGPS